MGTGRDHVGILWGMYATVYCALRLSRVAVTTRRGHVRISSVTARLLRASPDEGVVFAGGHYASFSAVLVEVTTDTGLVGHGEAIARTGGEATARAVESLLGPALVGEDPLDIEGLFRKQVDLLRRFGHSAGMVVEAISGVDVALWDIAGQHFEVPVYRLLLGAGRSTVPVYASSVYLDTVDRMIARTEAQVAAGFSDVKLKVGHDRAAGGKRTDLAKIAAIREAVGPDVGLSVDANSAYDAADGLWMAQRLAQLDIAFFEEPVHPDDLDGYARIRSRSDVPLAGGETLFLANGFAEYFRRGLLDVVQPDVARCGGITGARHVATLAAAHGVRFAPHTGFSGGISHLAALHVAAWAPSLYLLEYMFIDNPLREIFEQGFPRPRGGELPVPDAPGLGLALDAEKVERYATTVPSDPDMEHVHA